MKLIYLIKNMGISIILVLCLFTLAFGMENVVTDVNHPKVKAILEKHLERNPGLLDSSKGKDIVVFLGNTGAGKSTSINYLSKKELLADDSDDILLANPHDVSAMAINDGFNSETELPRFVRIGDLLLYDLPGFRDTRGTANSLVNACFIKGIIENANSVRLVFVAGTDQITADKAASFKDLLIQAKQLIPHKPIENFSALIITKRDPKVMLLDFLTKKLELTNPDLSILSHWIEHGRIDEIYKPMDSKINYGNRESILNLIGRMGHEQIENINIGVIYDTRQQMAIKEVYDAEIEGIIEKLIAENGCGLNLISGHIPRFIGESPTLDSLRFISPGELGIFGEGDKLFCKVCDKEAIEINGLSLEGFGRIKRTLKDTLNIENFNVAIKKQALAAFNYNIAYEGTTLSDIEALLDFTSLCGYTLLDKGTLQRKKYYIENGFNQCLSLSLEKSTLIRLLRPISEDIYQLSWREKNKILTLRVEKIVGQIDLATTDKEKKEAQENAAQLQVNVGQLQGQVNQFNVQVNQLQGQVGQLQQAASHGGRNDGRNGFEGFFHDWLGL